MAACQLTIKLDTKSACSGGKPITGTVVVKADKPVNCKGLIAKTTWSTHGRGNVESGDVDEKTLFEGAWQAGQEYSYPFSLATPLWPPTYNGTYLNVGHYVFARAKLSWALDPKSQVEYCVEVEDAPEGLKPTAAPPKKTGLVLGVVLGALALAFGLAFLPLLLILLAIGAPIAAVIYFINVVLPKRVTGPVTCELKAAKFRAGQPLQARLEFTPPNRSTINGIEWTIRCAEECSSGSGSSRQTHTNEILKETIQSSGMQELKAGEKQSIDFEYQLPNTAPPALKFSDNKLTWTVKARIDIPRWPDWTKSLDVIVIPATSSVGSTAGDFSGSNSAVPPLAASSARGPVSLTASDKTLADDVWLRQVISQIQQTQHDVQALALVLSAVRDFAFPISLSIEQEVDTPEFDDEVEFERWDIAEWWGAYCPTQNIDVVIAWEDGSPPDVQSNSTWQGNASIVGYKSATKQLLMEAT